MTKITRAELIPVSSPMAHPLIMPNTYITEIHSVMLKLYTDDGAVGFADAGDTSTWYRGEMQSSMMAMLADHIIPQAVIGADPNNIEAIVAKMDLLFNENNQSKALVDFALHDLKGKLLDTPVYNLLGGKTKDFVETGWVSSPGTDEEVVDEAEKAFAAGYSIVKQKIGRGSVDADVAMIQALREGVGPDRKLVADVNGFWNYEEALHALKELEDVNLFFIEQPLPRWDVLGMARLRNKIGTPVYADEAVQDINTIRNVVEAGAADGLMIKMQKVGGLVKAKRFLTMARAYGLPVLSGCMSGSGLEASPAAHFLVADEWASNFVHENVGPLTNHHQFDTVSGNPHQDLDIAKNVPVFKDGKLFPNEGPGLGIELNEEFIAEYQTPGKSILVVE